MAFCDRVLRPESPEVAARQLRRVVTAGPPRFLSPADRALLRWGARLSSALPGAVMPLARRRLRAMVGGLLADATDPALRRHLAALRCRGVRGQREPAGRGRARAHRGGASACRRAGTHGAPRRGLRLGQGVVGLRAAQPVGVRGHAQADQGRPARHPRRRQHHAARFRQPRHGGVQGPGAHARCLHRPARRARVPRTRGRHCAAGLPARVDDGAGAPLRLGHGPPPPRRRPDQGAHRQGRQPGRRTGRGGRARVAAGALRRQGRDGRQPQGHAGLRVAARARRRPLGRDRRSQRLRPGLGPPVGRETRRERGGHVRTARGHGPGGRPGRPGHDGPGRALHAHRRAVRLRPRAGLPVPAPRGERGGRQLPRGVRAAGRRRRLRRASAPASPPPWPGATSWGAGPGVTTAAPAGAWPARRPASSPSPTPIRPTAGRARASWARSAGPTRCRYRPRSTRPTSTGSSPRRRPARPVGPGSRRPGGPTCWSAARPSWRRGVRSWSPSWRPRPTRRWPRPTPKCPRRSTSPAITPGWPAGSNASTARWPAPWASWPSPGLGISRWPSRSAAPWPRWPPATPPS